MSYDAKAAKKEYDENWLMYEPSEKQMYERIRQAALVGSTTTYFAFDSRKIEKERLESLTKNGYTTSNYNSEFIKVTF